MAQKKEKKEKETVKISVDPNKSAEIQLVDNFNKKFGTGAMVRLADDIISSVKEFVDTGSYLVNDIISNGRGWPVGKIVTITGKKSSGKSTLAAHLLAATQKIGGLGVLLDSEYAFDVERAKVIGVDVDKLLITQPNHLEQTLEAIEQIIAIGKAANKLVVIVWDSVAATPTQSEVEGAIGEGGHYGEHSKVLSAGFRKLMKIVSENRVILFVVNQIKQKINAGLYENPNTFIAQNPLEYHSHIMIEIAQCGLIKDNDDNVIGIMSRVKCTKNRVAPPFRSCEIPIMFDVGVDRALEALEIGKKYRRAKLNGAWNQIMMPCGICLGENSKACDACEKEGVVQDTRFKQFYTKDIRTVLAENPGLEQYLVKGTELQKHEFQYAINALTGETSSGILGQIKPLTEEQTADLRKKAKELAKKDSKNAS